MMNKLLFLVGLLQILLGFVGLKIDNAPEVYVPFGIIGGTVICLVALVTKSSGGNDVG